MDYAAVSAAVRRFGRRLERDSAVRRAMERIEKGFVECGDATRMALFRKLFGGGCGGDQECIRQLWLEYNYTKGKTDEACTRRK